MFLFSVCRVSGVVVAFLVCGLHLSVVLWILCFCLYLYSMSEFESYGTKFMIMF